VQLLHVSLSWFWCNSLLKCISQLEIEKKSIKPLFWHSKSSKVIEFGGNREPVYNFLLVINSNLGPISHHFWDTATYWLKITNFPYPLTFSTLIRGDSFWVYGKALGFLKLESTEQPTEDLVILACAIFLLIHPCDRQTEVRWLRHTKAVVAFARENHVSTCPTIHSWVLSLMW